MNKLPSIINTYQNALKLYGQTFIQVLPFALILGLAEHFYNDVATKLSANPEQALTSHDWTVFGGASLIYFVIYTLLFSIVLYGMYQKYHQQPFDYEQAVMKGGPRTLPIVLSVLIMISPLIIALSGMVLLDLVLSLVSHPVMSNVAKLFMAVYYIALVLVMIGFMVIFPYFYVSGVLIVCKGHSAWSGLKQSWNITKGHWWKTFFLLAILLLIIGLLNWGLKFVAGDFSDEIMTVLTFSLGISLVLIYCDNLEKAYGERTNTPVPTIPAPH